MYAGEPLNTVTSSSEPQSGQGMRFSVFSAMVAVMLYSFSHFGQRRS
jgi:hypothetical protein